MSQTWSAQDEEKLVKFYDLYPGNMAGLIHDYFPGRTSQQLHDKYHRLRNSNKFTAVLERMKLKNGEAKVIEVVKEKIINENKCVSCDRNCVCSLSISEKETENRNKNVAYGVIRCEYYKLKSQ
jgi:hypothetical protein